MRKKNVFKIGILLYFISLLFTSLDAQVKLPRLIGDGMVLQRNEAILIWGWAAPGEEIQVSFKEYNLSAASDSKGNWEVVLPAQSAGGPYTMIIEGTNKIVLNDVLIGDVWICSGQSNIQTPMSRLVPLYPNEIAQSENNFVRYFAVPVSYDFKTPLKDYKSGSWQHTNPQTVPAMGGVPYFFGKDLYKKYNVPIGLINVSDGGSPIESWLSEDVLKEFPESYGEALKWRDDSLIAKTKADDRARSGKWYHESIKMDQGYIGGELSWRSPEFDDSEWSEFEIPSLIGELNKEPINGIYWFRKKFLLPETEVGKPAQVELGRIKDADSVFINSAYVGSVTYEYPPRRYAVPEGALRAGENLLVIRLISNSGRGGFAPDKPYNIKVGDAIVDLSGTWKYKLGTEMPALASQTFIRWKPLGLYNAMMAPLFNYAIKGMVWYQGEANTANPEIYATYLPALANDLRENWNLGDFPFLFVQLPNFMEEKEEPSESNWAVLRETQRGSLSIKNSGMAITIDLGEWNDIHPMNKKDVAQRLSLNAQYIAYREANVVYSGPLYDSMEIDGNRIILSFTCTGSGLMIKDGDSLKHFAIAGEDGKFVWAEAQIKGDKVVVWSEAINKPVEVRYAWADNPESANLSNKEGLPASPFSTATK